MKASVPHDWRPKQLWKRRFYAKYMAWLERLGFLVVTLAIGGFIYAFVYRVDEVIKADGVEIVPETRAIESGAEWVVARAFVKHGSEVKKGDRLFEIVEGPEKIAQFSAKSALEHLAASSGGQNWAALNRQMAAPQTLIVTAPIDGTLLFDGESGVGKTVYESGSPVASVANFNTLLVKPSLAGPTAPLAVQGNRARISNIVVAPENRTLFRGFRSGSALVIGSFSLADLDDIIGKAVSIRDDLPFEIKEIKDVQVDANVETHSNPSTDGVPLNPGPAETYVGKVVSGEHNAELQLTNLPPEIAEKFRAELDRQARAAHFTSPTGPLKISQVANPNFVVKVKAAARPGRHGDMLSGVAVGRTYDAVIELENPSESLKSNVQRAVLSGRKVTARVEVTTGSRPIAHTLLKKS